MLDAGKPGDSDAYGTYRPGPIASRVENGLGSLPAGTLLRGQLWQDGTRVHAHYTEAQPPDGQPVPLCAVLGTEARSGIHPQAGSTPGTLLLPQRVRYTVVDTFE